MLLLPLLQVKFILKHNSRLGEVWKLSGNTAELGNWVPEVSPSLSWREGGVWSAEVALPPGNYSFKCMLRTADGSYVWESGENRTIYVSATGGMAINHCRHQLRAIECNGERHGGHEVTSAFWVFSVVVVLPSG